MPTQPMKVPTATAARNVQKNVVDLYNRELVNRAFEDDAIPVSKLDLSQGYTGTVSTVLASGAALTIDLATADLWDITLTADCTFTFTGAPPAGTYTSFTLILRQDATPPRLVTWPASVLWPGGVAPTLTNGANAIDIVSFVTTDGGTTWFGTSGLLNFS